jgi:uncharacterized protein
VLLSPEEGRVIGSLIEKQLTTPQQYPLTMNSLVLACNQSSNRDPVVEFDERTVHNALTSLKSAGLVRFVNPSHCRSVTRYRQVLEEQLALGDTELALLGVLLLRGPQTAGELRVRTERMAQFDGIAAVDSELERLAHRPDPLIRRLARRPGQKEERWVHLLTGDEREVPAPAPAPVPDPRDDHQGGAAGDHGTLTGASPGGASPGRVAALEEEVAELRDEVKQLRSDLDDLRTQLGS